MLTVQTPPLSTKLTTVSALKTELKLASASDDSFLDSLIQQASDAIARYCNRTFGLATYLETVAGFNTVWLQLSVTPIVAVASVLYNGTIAVTDYTLEEPDAGLLRRDAGWIWTFTPIFNLEAWPQGRGESPQYSVNYQAGFKLPNDDGRTLPFDIERAAIITAKGYYLDRRSNPNALPLVRKRIGDVEVQYGTRPEEDPLPPVAARLLGPWRRLS